MITFAVEPYRDVIEELKPLFPGHWDELALNKDKVPLDPRYEVYEAKDAAGEVMMVIGREAGAIVAYFVGFISPGLHYKTCLTCQGDIFYVVPEKRNGTAGVKMFAFVKAECRRRGVQRMFVGSKNHKASASLLQFVGGTEIETYFSFWLGE